MLNNDNDRKRSQGYDRIALLFASDPSISIFRRFDKLNAKNLLYYQAELAKIEHDLEYIIADDKLSSDEERCRYSFSVEDLKRSSGSTTPEEKAQWLKFLEARELLERYTVLDSALLQQRDLLNLTPPNQVDLCNLQYWLSHQMDEDKVNFEALAEMHVYNKGQKDTMVTLSSRDQGVDILTRWILGRPTQWFDGWLGRRLDEEYDPELGTWRYSDKKIRSLTYLVSIIVAAVLPATCMLVLYFVKDTAGRILTVIIYNILFSMSLGLLVQARRVEIFAAVSAFAAVQVTLITNS